MYEGLVPISLLLKNIEVIFAPKQWPCFYCRQNRSHRVSPKSCLQTQSSTGTVLITSSGFPTHKEHCLTFSAPPTPSLFFPAMQISIKCHVLDQAGSSLQQGGEMGQAVPHWFQAAAENRAGVTLPWELPIYSLRWAWR